MSDRAHTAAVPPSGAPDDVAADEARLHAYHDGELSRLARWRFERRLRREPALRRELEALGELRALLREIHAEASPPASPTVWQAIAPRLPAVRERPAAARRRPALGWLAVPGAVAAAAALVLAVVHGWHAAAPAAPEGAVRWLDSGQRNVMVLEGDSDTTIIWVLDPPTEGARWGGGREAA